MRKSRVLIFSLFAILLCVLPSMATAFSPAVGPSLMAVSVGTPSSTNLALIASNSSSGISISSNNTGDGNYYESYSVNSLSDFESYFNITDQYYYSWLTESFVAAKADNSGHEHDGVIELSDASTPKNGDWPSNQSTPYENIWIEQVKPIYNGSLQSSGDFEFWFFSDSLNGTFMISFGQYTYHHYLNSSNQEKGAGYGINFGIEPGLGGSSTSSFFTSTNWSAPAIKINGPIAYTPDTWYHVKLSFKMNDSWAVAINTSMTQGMVYNSTWTNSMASNLTRFDDVNMYTQTKTEASGYPNHNFYIDAMGLSYNMTSNNAHSSMQFNTDYQPYVDRNSHNDLNDHVVNATLTVLFEFPIGNNLNQTGYGRLIFNARFSDPIDSGKLLLFNYVTNIFEVYDSDFDWYLPYTGAGSVVPTYLITSNGNNSINATDYIGGTGNVLACEITAQSSTYAFQYEITYVAIEFNTGIGTGTITIILLLIIGLVVVAIVYFSIKRGTFDSQRSLRGSRGR
jgi:hypothetical protein